MREVEGGTSEKLLLGVGEGERVVVVEEFLADARVDAIGWV